MLSRKKLDIHADLIAKSNMARKQRKWINRMFTCPVANGEAYYTITRISGKLAYVQAWYISNSYEDYTISAMNNWIPLSMAQKLVNEYELVKDSSDS